MVKISTSILSSNYLDVIEKINKTNTDYIHIDVMDGNFVFNKAFSISEISELKKYTKKPLDIHLMVNDIDYYIEKIKHLKPTFITFHYEVLNDLDIIKKIKNNGIKCGISVKPNTDIKEIYHLLAKIDLVLIMGVEPGYSGQEFIPTTLTKIKLLKEELKNQNLNPLISVDGGVNKEIAFECIKAGADILVANTFIINSHNFQERISLLRGISEEDIN
ncbi:MAG: ribulose-phosphate 3-epimerase [Bacilli bacterium]|jgi:ribulose-phosphate 3-epimerase|nr:ribulose-phosphate 3-epimerase [Bacilli bacterium]